MKAIRLHAYGDADKLVYEDSPTPKAGAGEILVKVLAASVNPVDWKLRSGALKEVMPLELPATLGRDIAGEVTEVGSGVTGFGVGDRILALGNGGYAEYAVVKPEGAAKIPQGLGYTEAGALPLVTLTGAQLIERGVKPTSGQTVLVTGALGAVGRTAVFAARALGARVIAGVRGKQKAEAALLGADSVVALDSADELAGLPDLDGVADTVGHGIGKKLLPKIKRGGVFASVVESLDAAKEKGVRAEMVWTQPDAKRLGELARDVAEKKLAIPVGKTLPLEKAAEAHTLGQKGGIGKIVLLVGSTTK